MFKIISAPNKSKKKVQPKFTKYFKNIMKAPAKTPSFTNRNKKTKIKYKIYPLQETSTKTYLELSNKGYDTIIFVASPNACDSCQSKNGMRWNLKDELDYLKYDAMLFEHSHVNSKSNMRVIDSKGTLPDVFVDFKGRVFKRPHFIR